MDICISWQISLSLLDCSFQYPTLALQSLSTRSHDTYLSELHKFNRQYYNNSVSRIYLYTVRLSSGSLDCLRIDALYFRNWRSSLSHACNLLVQYDAPLITFLCNPPDRLSDRTNTPLQFQSNGSNLQALGFASCPTQGFREKYNYFSPLGKTASSCVQFSEYFLFIYFH